MLVTTLIFPHLTHLALDGRRSISLPKPDSPLFVGERFIDRSFGKHISLSWVSTSHSTGNLVVDAAMVEADWGVFGYAIVNVYPTICTRLYAMVIGVVFVVFILVG